MRHLILLPCLCLVLACGSARIRTGPVAPGLWPRLITRAQVLLMLRAQVAKSGYPAQRIVGAFVLPERMGGGVLALWIDPRDRPVIAYFADGLGGSGTMQPISVPQSALIRQFWPRKGSPELRYVRFPLMPDGVPAIQFEIHLDGKHGNVKTELVLLVRYVVSPSLRQVLALVQDGKRVEGTICARRETTARGRLVARDLDGDGRADLLSVVSLRMDRYCDLDGLCDEVRRCESLRREVRQAYLWDARSRRYRRRRDADRTAP